MEENLKPVDIEATFGLAEIVIEKRISGAFIPPPKETGLHQLFRMFIKPIKTL